MPDPQREFWSAIDTELAMANYGAAQTWTALESYTLTEVWLRMANSAPAYNGTLTLDLYTVTANEPDTKIATLWSGSVNAWGSVMSWRFLTGISQAITNGVTYAFVVNLNPLRDATHYIRWSGKAGYAGGIGYQENTDEVYTNAGIDFHFVNYGTAASPPTKATNPTPANSATVDFSDRTLSWDDGGGSDTYNVYVGPQGSLSLVSSAQAGTSKVVDTGDVPWGVDVYWRIDSTNAQGTTTGDTWSFTTLPEKASIPVPTDDQENLLITGKDRLKKLLWTAPAGEAPDYKIYFRAEGDSWVLQETITDGSTSYTLSQTILDALSYYSIYEWRIDSVGYGGTTTGDTWTFISQQSPFSTTLFTRRSDYDPNLVWQPTVGWVNIEDFEYTGGGRYKNRIVVVGHKVIYFGDV